MPPDDVPLARVALIAARGVCHAGCTHPKCDAARLALEVLRARALDKLRGASS